MSSTPALHSFHAFLFPFEWKPKNREGQPFEKQVELTPICRVLDIARDDWEKMPPWSKPVSLVQYNEANYFYDFVRPVLYGDGDAKYQVYYKHRKAPGSTYVIRLENGKEFRLELDDIGLSFYNSGVGILSFHCYNREHPESADILKINQFGRRLFPPFFGTDGERIGTQEFFSDARWQKGLEDTKNAELAQSIVLKKNGSAWATEDFQAWADGAPIYEQTPGLLRQLLPPALPEMLDISPVLDDRMFVVCWYGNDELSQKMKTTSFEAQPDENDWWYQFIFVDGGFRTCRNSKMVTSLLTDHSNLRWQDEGTFYGVSRYSFVCLTQTFTTNNFSKTLCSHVQTHYLKLAELALLQRGCVLRFSDEVTAISDLSEKNRALGAHVSSLYKQYIRFVNKIYFREVTAQEQGIELYDLLQKHMRIENQVKDLDREIEELHNYVSLLEEDRRNAQLDILTLIGAFFVVPSFVCSYLGISDFQMKTHWGQVAALCLLSALSFFALIRSNGRWRQIFFILAVLLMIFILFIFPSGKL